MTIYYNFPWNKYLATRLIYQLIAAVVIPAIFVLAFMYTYLIVMLGFKKEEVQFFNTEFPISILFIVFWNVVYVGYFFYRESKKSNRELLLLKEQLFTLQNVKTGSDVIPTLPEKNIADTKEEETDFTEIVNTAKIKILVAVSGSKNIPIPVETIAYFYKDGNYTTLKTFQSETYLLNHSLDELMKLLEETLFFRANRQFIINLKACQKRAPAFKEWLNK